MNRDLASSLSNLLLDSEVQVFTVVLGHRSVAAKFKMAASNQFQHLVIAPSAA